MPNTLTPRLDDLGARLYTQAKEVTGRIVDDKNIEEGMVESTIGKIQAGYGDLKADLKKVIKKDS